MLALAGVAHADTIPLQPGQSVTVSPGVVVTCASGGADWCQEKAGLFRDKLELCLSQKDTHWCVVELWSPYKSNNPSCIDEGSAVCVELCRQRVDLTWCLNECQ